MRNTLIASWLLFCPLSSTHAQVGVELGMPGVDIGIIVPVYPRLVVVPGYPVYYAPRAEWNYFFYDGVYWVYEGDNWYASSWYDGPWQWVTPEYVPLFVLRVPVRYYRRPPAYFRGWSPDAPPRWGEHWGREWERHRGGWDRWDRRSTPRAAPLPVYQRRYSGDRYPREAERQHAIRSENYRYQPREAVTQQQLQRRGVPAPEPRRQAPVQHAQPSRPVQQAQPAQAAPPKQHPRPAPRDEQREREATSPDRGRQQRAAPQDGGREGKNEDQGKDHH